MEQLRAQGIIDPSSEPKAPEVKVYDDLIWAWNAFWRLSASRDTGFDRPNRIKVSEVKAFADLLGYAPVKARDLLFYVDKLDERWMEHVNDLREEQEEQRKKKANNQTPAKPTPKRR